MDKDNIQAACSYARKANGLVKKELEGLGPEHIMLLINLQDAVDRLERLTLKLFNEAWAQSGLLSDRP